MNMTDFNKVLDRLVFLLQSSNPNKIILFGSYAKGKQDENSDIDIMVVLDDNHVAKTYQERLDKKLRIRNLVLDINRKYALDILVYSNEELKILKKQGNQFIEDIEQTGKIIYEKTG